MKQFAAGIRVAPYRHPVFGAGQSLEKEIAVAEEKLRIDPNGPFTLATLASIYVRQAKNSGDFELFDRAERLARRSLEILPSFNGRSKLILADIAQARHQFERSIQLAYEVIYGKYSKASPVDAYNLVVTSELALGDLEAANKTADHLVELMPMVSTHTLRALVLNARGRNVEALHDFRRALELETFGDAEGSAWLRTMMARFYLKLGKVDIASDLVKEALRISPRNHHALGLLAEVELKQGKAHEANAHFVEAFSFSHQLVYLVGQVRAMNETGDKQSANDLRDQVVKLIRRELSNPKGYAHRTELIRLLLERNRSGDNEEAVRLARIEVGSRHNAETEFYFAKALYQVGSLAEARKMIQEVLRTGVQDGDYFALAARIVDRLNDKSETMFYLERARELGAA